MNIPSKEIIEKLYSSAITMEIESTPEQKELRKKYNDLFDIIQDEELKSKFVELEELKNQLLGDEDKEIFKAGFVIATQLLIESLTCEIIE